MTCLVDDIVRVKSRTQHGAAALSTLCEPGGGRSGSFDTDRRPGTSRSRSRAGSACCGFPQLSVPDRGRLRSVLGVGGASSATTRSVRVNWDVRKDKRVALRTRRTRTARGQQPRADHRLAHSSSTQGRARPATLDDIRSCQQNHKSQLYNHFPTSGADPAGSKCTSHRCSIERAATAWRATLAGLRRWRYALVQARSAGWCLRLCPGWPVVELSDIDENSPKATLSRRSMPGNACSSIPSPGCNTGVLTEEHPADLGTWLLALCSADTCSQHVRTTPTHGQALDIA